VSEPLVDAELVWMIFLILGELGVKSYKIEVNSVGCRQCRDSFRGVLVEYFETKRDHLCEDCLRRLARNPLRIFDCKNTQCIEVTAQSPLLYDHLCGNCKEHFDTFLTHINDFGIAVDINKRLVRGLDYYTKTVFEITSEELGSQKAFVAGGRYDNLVEEMAGPVTPGIGFAVGVERLAMLTRIKEFFAMPSCFFAYLGGQAKSYLIPILKAFASAGVMLDYSYEDKSLKSQMRYADSLHADFVLILGDEEVAKGTIILRDMKSKNQHELPLNPSEILREFKKFL
jgi:histidyl-tRNA synthetase